MTTPTPGQPLSEADVSLLPCPFCGGEASAEMSVRADTYGCWIAGCDNEQCAPQPYTLGGDKGASIAAWNRRPHAPVSRPGDGVEGERIDYLRRSRDGHAANAHAEFEKRVMATDALISAREALHQHYVDWDGEPEDAVPLQEARDECDRVLDAIAALTPPAEPVSRPAGEGEREAVARIIDPSAFLFAPHELPKGSRAQYDAFDKADRILSLLRPAAPDAVRFYIDCEFDGHNGPLLSMALVREDGHSIHIRADIEPMDLWVRKNVLPIMDQHDASESATVYHDRVGDVIRQFIGRCERPVIIADSPVDIGRFCRALSTGSDGQWASTDYPMMQFEVHNVDCYPTSLEGAVQHNAWWDAMALRAFLSKVEERGHDAPQNPATEGVGS